MIRLEYSMQIRTAEINDVPGITQVHIQSWQTTYANILPAAFLANLSYERRAQYWQQLLSNSQAAEKVFVAVDEQGQIGGFASGGPEREGDQRYTSELYAIYLLQAHQGQGLGRRLVQAVARYLLSEQHSTMLVWVLADNPACRFYARLGGQLVSEKEIDIGGTLVRELAYGWDDIRSLTAED
jgi:GNAT superfamily N-acetyltransferase